MHFVKSTAISSLFCKFTSQSIVYLLIYVNDIIIIGSYDIIIESDDREIHTLVSTLHTKFGLKHLGHLNYFLDIEVHTLHNGDLMLTQGKYIHDLLLGTHTDQVKLITTPMTTI